MTDIRTAWNADRLFADWLLANAGAGPGLDDERDLETAVVISLFSDRLAAADDRLPDESGDRRGWWADTGAEEGLLGSRLWLISQEKQTEETRRRAEDYAREALNWLLEDRVAQRLEVTGAWLEPGFLSLRVIVYRADGGPLERRWDFVWSPYQTPGTGRPVPRRHTVWDGGNTVWDDAQTLWD